MTHPEDCDRIIDELEAENDRLRLDLQDAGMSVRRLLYAGRNKPLPQKLVDQMNDWLKRKGLQGSILRSPQPTE